MQRLTRKARAIVLFSGVAIVVLGTWWAYRQSGFSPTILRRGRAACGNRMPCIFTLANVFPGDWDRLVVFDVSASQDEIDKAVGPGVRKPDLERLVVFLRGSKVLRTTMEPEPVEAPDANFIYFDRVPVIEHHITVQGEWVFVLVRGAPGCESCETLERVLPGETVI